MLFDLLGGPVGRGVRTAGAVVQTPLTVRGGALDPSPDARAGDIHRRGDVGLSPSGAVSLHDQQPAVERGARVSVGLSVTRNSEWM